MSDEPFLARWSRRKREAAVEPAAPVKQDEGEAKAPIASRDESRTPARDERGVAARPSQSAPAFDPASLPSLDSITATTDVRAFLQPGVPSTLTREALRRAWSSDPAIRDFVGLQEYDWDYNTPGAMAGFGELGSEHNIKDKLAKVFGEHRPPEDRADTRPSSQPSVNIEESSPAEGVQASTAETEPSHVAEAVDPRGGADDRRSAVETGQQTEGSVQRDEEVAMQHEQSRSQTLQEKPALPWGSITNNVI